MKQGTVEFLSTIFSIVFLNTLFLPQLLSTYATVLSETLKINSRLFGVLIFLNAGIYAFTNVLSIFFFCLNLVLRLRSQQLFDQKFIINVVLMPVPLVFFFTGLIPLIFVGLPSFLSLLVSR